MFTFPLSASSAPLRESILHAGAQRTPRVCTWTKAVRVAHRRETSNASAPALSLKAIPVYARNSPASLKCLAWPWTCG